MYEQTRPTAVDDFERGTFEGVQVAASLYGCSERQLLTDVDALLAMCRTAVDSANLQRVADCAHGFVAGGGVSAVVVLAESHVAIHTWPEFDAVTLDVYACSYQRDNTGSARALVRRISEAFGATKTLRREIPRDSGAVDDWTSDGHGVFIRSDGLLLDQQSNYQRIELHETPTFGKLLRLDGRNQCSEAEAFIYHEALVHPALTTSAHPRDVLVIGGGDGGAAAEALRHPTIESVQVVEIDEMVVDVAREHLRGINEGVFDDARVELIIADGARYVSMVDTQWDLILLDLTDEEGPAQDLYRAEFLARCASKLRPGGSLVLHLDAPFGLPGRLQRHFGVISSVFPIVRVQLINVPLYGELAIAVCSVDADPLAVSADEIDRRLADRGLSALRSYDGPAHHARFVLPPWVRRMLDGARDDAPGKAE
jgi:spermidine synthase